MTDTQIVPPPTRIATPENFPVAWSRPEEANLLFEFDKMHAPTPISPLTGDVAETVFSAGFSNGARNHQAPIFAQVRRINTYYYMAISPVSHSPEEMAALGERAQAAVGATMGRFQARWDEEWLPEIKRHLAFFDAYPLTTATDAALVTHLDETLRRYQRLWEIHFEIALPMLLAPSLFADAYRDLFGDDNGLEAYRLLQGFSNKTIESGHELWRLSRFVLDQADIRAVIEQEPAGAVMAKLKSMPAAQPFVAMFNAYLQEYGQRGLNFVELAEPTWIEDPAPAIENLKDYLARPDHDPIAELARSAAARERLIADARAKLVGYPKPAIEQFEGLLQAAQTGIVLSEDHGFWIDFRSSYRVRLVALEFGRRFVAAGLMNSAADVFMLTAAEIRETLMQRHDRHQLVAERRAEMAHFAAITPPPLLGTLPPGPPPDDAMGRAMMRFFGGPPNPKASVEPNIIRGNAGSAGVVRGPARVIRTLSDAHRVQAGDILVAETTAPPWTPLFATVAGVVTDTGGVLSHCAVVAREYGIPAVVGAHQATMLIRDGDIIEIDGAAGIVRTGPMATA